MKTIRGLGTKLGQPIASKLNDILAVAQLAPTLRTCLYVEDSFGNLLLARHVIARRNNLKLLSANSGPLGVQVTGEPLPDIIIMDVNLPGFNGLEVLRILRADPVTTKIPVTALSSNAYPKQIEEVLREGFFRYVTKPSISACNQGVIESAGGRSRARFVFDQDVASTLAHATSGNDSSDNCAAAIGSGFPSRLPKRSLSVPSDSISQIAKVKTSNKDPKCLRSVTYTVSASRVAVISTPIVANRLTVAFEASSISARFAFAVANALLCADFDLACSVS